MYFPTTAIRTRVRADRRIRSTIAFHGREVGLLGLEPEPLADLAVEPLLVEPERDLVDAT